MRVMVAMVKVFNHMPVCFDLCLSVKILSILIIALADIFVTRQIIIVYKNR